MKRMTSMPWRSILAAALVLGACGLAAGGEPGIPQNGTSISGVDYVVLVDCTGTMRFGGRAEAAERAVAALIDATQPGDCITVYGYGEEPFAAMSEYPVMLESEESKEYAKHLLALSFDADRTDITRGLELAWNERELVFPNSTAAGARADRASLVILITDGKLIPNYDNYSQYDSVYAGSKARLLELGDLFGRERIPVYTIGLGGADKVDGDLLAAVSKKSGGQYLHAATSDDLPGVLDALTGAIVQPRARGESVVASDEPEVSSGSAQGKMVQSADAVTEDESTQHHPTGNRAMSAANDAFRKSATATVHQTVVGVLGVIMGFVAIGVQRRQSWTRTFTKPLLRKEIRVRGYLKPVYPEGVVGVRCAIPIENPGLPAVEIGTGQPYAGDTKDTLLEFVGTPDGTPPLLRVLRGSVRVAGEEVAEERRLQDGDIIEFEDNTYQYLRGNRR